MKAPLAAATLFTHDLGAQHYIHLVLAVREENWSDERKPLRVRLRSTNNSPHICPKKESNPGHSGGRCEC